jgi:prefoldin subunit 5
VLVGGLVLVSAFAAVTIQENALARTITDLNAQISYEQAYRGQLQASSAEKKTSDYVIEKAKQLGWVWPWEALIAVQRDANARAQSTTQSERPSRVTRWIALFVGTR